MATDSYAINMEAAEISKKKKRKEAAVARLKVHMDKFVDLWCKGHGEDITIFRVPESIRSVNPDAYTPTTISIGPYHREKPEIDDDIVKYQYLQKLLDRNPKVTLEEYLGKVMELESRARKCYSESLPYLSEQEFAMMMLFDGCFIVQLLLMVCEEKVEEEAVYPNAAKLRNTGQVIGDILRVENQLPFFVVESLFHLNQGESISLSYKAISAFRRYIHPWLPLVEQERTQQQQRFHFHHLLHLLHCGIKPSSVPTWVPAQGEIQVTNINMCATELETAGIKFRKAESDSFLDITFQEDVLLGGVIRFPHLTLDGFHAMVLRNLIAFEQGYPGAGSYAISFAYLMNGLVKKPADIALLQRHGVLTNVLGSDEEMAVFFNKLTKGTQNWTGSDYYWPLYRDVERYCGTTGNRWRVKVIRWRAKLLQDYFSNPWAFLSLLAALLIITLTIVQTVFAVKSYNNPSRS